MRKNRRVQGSPAFDYNTLECRKLLAADMFAPIDGFGNNVENPELGTVGEQFTRIADAAYADGLSEPARLDEANARDISNLLSAQEESVENDRFITSMWFQWGQFLDHDINRVFDVAPESTSEQTSLDISDEFPFDRSVYDVETGITTAREQVNHVTSFIDASVVYGSDEAHALALRTLEGGMMRSQTTDQGELLPANDTGLINVPAPIPQFFVAGDVRSNENVGLTSMQTIWVREHNRLATELAETEFAGQDLSDPEVDEAIYQRARQVVMGLVQNITYNEFLPSTVGFNALGTYQGYDSTVNPQISNEFTTAAFRIGHTTLANELLIGADGDSIELANAFFQPQFVYQNGIEGILEGLTIQQMQEVDSLVVEGVRNFLDDGPGFDLAAINIQRGRDHGLPDFNTMREAIGLDPINDFSELTSDPELAQKFEDIYGSPDNADPWIAMIAEDQLPGTMTGETMFAYIVDQFERLRTGDRFYFENLLDQDLVDEIKATRLSDVIERNTDLDVQDEVFWTRDTLVFRNGLDNEWLIRDFGDNGGAEVVFFGEPGIRDPDNRTETSPVQRDEPINAVIIAGTNELGDGFFIPNDLVSSPLADQGIDEFIVTADIDFFEGYGLGGNDTWVFESDIDSIFASGDDGDDVLTAETDLEGAVVELTGGTGADEISIDAPNAETIVATGDEGRDSISIEGTNAGEIVVDGGRGRDRIRIDGAMAASIIALGGAGNDRIDVDARRAERVEVMGENGRDRIDVLIGRRTDAEVDGGRGRDQVNVRIVGRGHGHHGNHGMAGNHHGSQNGHHGRDGMFANGAMDDLLNNDSRHDRGGRSGRRG